MGLSDVQLDDLAKIMAESSGAINALFMKVSQKELTPEQAVEDLARCRAGADARAKAILTEAQFRTYQDRMRSMREETTKRLLEGSR